MSPLYRLRNTEAASAALWRYLPISDRLALRGVDKASRDGFGRLSPDLANLDRDFTAYQQSEAFTRRQNDAAEHGYGMLKNSGKVFVQTYKMSGDRFSIAASLILDPTAGVVILADNDPKSTQRAAEIRTFYLDSKIPPENVRIHQVLHQRYTQKPGAKPADLAYQEFKAWSRGAQPGPLRPAWLDRAVRRRSYPLYQWGSRGTATVGQHLQERGAETVRASVRAHWTFDNDAEKLTLLGALLAQWGFQPKTKYVLLWAKKGAKTAAKAHHFVPLDTWQELARRCRGVGYTPVAAGDDIGLDTTPNLAQFWSRDEWKSVFPSSRIAQLALYGELARQCPELKSVGMISGALEGPALLGIPTMYLEERTSERFDRFHTWSNGRLPGFEHFAIAAPPGYEQQKYWADFAKDAPERLRKRYEALLRYAKATDNEQLAKVSPEAKSVEPRLGYALDRSAAPEHRPDATDKMRALARTFADEALAEKMALEARFARLGPDATPQSDANEFDLTEPEWAEIIHWVQTGSLARNRLSAPDEATLRRAWHSSPEEFKSAFEGVFPAARGAVTTAAPPKAKNKAISRKASYGPYISAINKWMDKVSLVRDPRFDAVTALMRDLRDQLQD
ncbi:hypothetical protein [Micromonospora endophytica]|uniref:Uncharacterized protein n=1 Tax=Micromonospora endophytica TaxID=515350 RepID=A0A2W2DB61_9ACTN|nr:hypothetical protein [Micromonospora endophytica]PZF98029.1 hypothetical protein C1I93_10060 [Micromonospora endophytica]RIW49844.1 hypothetical protein D3H59_03535 [Micromonospora endophytica]